MASAASLSIAEITTECKQKLLQYQEESKSISDSKQRDWIDNRLADFNLWASGIGALAKNKSSLDARLELRPDLRGIVVDLLQLLDLLVVDCIELVRASTAKSQDTIASVVSEDKLGSRSSSSNSLSTSFDSDSSSEALPAPGTLSLAKHKVDDVLDQLARITFAIRQAGTRARLQKADGREDQRDDDDLQKLKRHLTALVLSARLPISNLLESSWDILESQLTGIESRLIQNNLKRRHRFLYQQAHSRRLVPRQEPSNISQPLVTITENASEQSQKTSITQSVTQGTTLTEPKKSPINLKSTEHEPSLRTDTTATAIAEEHKIRTDLARSEQSATLISVTVGKVSYPPAPKIGNQKLFKCPCCCQTLPVRYAERDRWRKHLAEDLSPYTCILPRCPRPENLYTTKEAWKSHLQNEHQMLEYWECLPCLDTPVFKSQQAFTDHILQVHADTISPSQIPMMISSLRYSVPVEVDLCPLCHHTDLGQDEIDRENMLDHIAEHVHNFSLRALPWPSNEKEIEPSDLSKVRVRDWDLGIMAQDLMERHNYVDSLAISTIEYEEWYRNWISKLKRQEYLEANMQLDEVPRGNYFDSNQYFEQATSTRTSVESSRGYQKLFVDEILRPFWNVPYDRNPHFHQHETEVDLLEDQILNTVSSLRVILYDFEGSGKTEVAKELAYRISSSSPEYSICWIDASNEGQIESSFHDIGTELEIHISEVNRYRTAEQRVWNYLAKDSIGPWLMIFDDVKPAFIESRIDAKHVLQDAAKRKPKDMESFKYTIPDRPQTCLVFLTRDRRFSKLYGDSAIVMTLSERPAILDSLDSTSPAFFQHPPIPPNGLDPQDYGQQIPRPRNPPPNTEEFLRAAFHTNPSDDSNSETVPAEAPRRTSIAEIPHNDFNIDTLPDLARTVSISSDSISTASQPVNPKLSERRMVTSVFQDTQASAIPSTGLTLLYETTSPSAEIIFVHGLGGHPYWTWAKKITSNIPPRRKRFRDGINGIFTRPNKLEVLLDRTVFWPLDLLKRDFPNCQIWTYGYDRQSLDASADTKSFLLEDLVATLLGQRSLIFITHDLGGLLVKKAMIDAYDTAADPTYYRIYECTKGIIYFGMPHQAIGDEIEFRRAINGLSLSMGPGFTPDINYLGRYNKRYLELMLSYRIQTLNFQEQPAKLVVGIAKATPVIPEEMSLLDLGQLSDKFVNAIVSTDHVNMCKFVDDSELGYTYVRSMVHKCLEDEVLPHLPSISSEALKSRPVFGISLAALYARDKIEVPIVVLQCIQAVDLYGLNTAGIYHLATHSPRVDRLQQLFDTDSSKVDFKDPAQFSNDIVSVTELLKRFFRWLPDSLFPRDRYKDFIAAAMHPGSTTRRDLLHAEIKRLPYANYATLRVLILHLYRVSSRSTTSYALAKDFGPILINTPSSFVDSDRMWGIRALHTIIKEAHSIFEDD